MIHPRLSTLVPRLLLALLAALAGAAPALATPADILTLPTPTPTPPALTPAQRSAQRLETLSNRTFAQLVATYNVQMREVWHNKDATPQEVIAAVGNKAASLFARGQALAAYILSQAPAAELVPIPEGVTVTPHQDGTVTITMP